MRLLLTLLLAAVATTSAQAQARDFTEALSGLEVGSNIPVDFITTYVNIPGQPEILEWVKVDGPYPTEFKLRELWTESSVTRLIVLYVGGPCYDAQLLTFDDQGGLIDDLRAQRGCDRDGEHSVHDNWEYRVIGDLIERRHLVDLPAEFYDGTSGTRREYRVEPVEVVYYDYFEVQSDGHIAALSLPQWVDERRSYVQASQRLLTPEELESMEPAEVRLMRNEIFASYGHVFEAADLREYFGNQPWYRPRDDASDRLTDIERRNVELIVRAEGN